MNQYNTIQLLAFTIRDTFCNSGTTNLQQTTRKQENKVKHLIEFGFIIYAQAIIYRRKHNSIRTASDKSDLQYQFTSVRIQLCVHSKKRETKNKD